MLKINKIIQEQRAGEVIVGLEFKLDKKEDALMAQAILRALVSESACVESSFGYSEGFQGYVYEFSYKCREWINQIFWRSGEQGKYAFSCYKPAKKK